MKSDGHAQSTLRALGSRVIPPAATLVGATVAAELILRALKLPRYLAPLPSDVLGALREHRAELFAGMLNTGAAAGMGFIASAIAGVIAAIVLASSSMVRRALLPYTVFFQTVPIVAIAPLLVIWLGPGLVSVTVSTFVVSVFPVITNTLAGLLATDPALEDLFTLYGAKPTDRLLKLRLPSALPATITGLRVAAGLAVIGAIVSEALVGRIDQGEGLGVMLRGAGSNGKADEVFALVLLSAVLGLILFGTVNLIGRMVLRHWRATARD